MIVGGEGFEHCNRKTSPGHCVIVTSVITILLITLKVSTCLFTRQNPSTKTRLSTSAVIIGSAICGCKLPVRCFQMGGSAVRPQRALTRILVGCKLSTRGVCSLARYPSAMFSIHGIHTKRPYALLSSLSDVNAPRCFICRVGTGRCTIFSLIGSAIAHNAHPSS